MKIVKCINSFFDRITHEIRLIKLKLAGITALVFLILGILSWILGGRADRVAILFVFPRSALPLGWAYTIWALSFAFCGFVFAGILFGCEKYKRTLAQKSCIFIVLMFIFTLCAYPLFFGALKPLFAFIAFLLSIIFCILAILSCYRIYSLWTILLGVHFLWLLYNLIISLAFTFVN